MCKLLLPGSLKSRVASDWRTGRGHGQELTKGKQVAVEREEASPRSLFEPLSPMGSEPLRVADGLASQLSEWVQCVSSKTAILCGWVRTHLYPFGQDLNEKVIWEHTAHQPGLPSNTGTDAEPPLGGADKERAGGDLMSGRRAGSQKPALCLNDYTIHTGHVASTLKKKKITHFLQAPYL